MAVQFGEEKKHKKLLAEEIAVFVLLLGISILGVVLGFKSFPANLSRPFEVQLASYTGEKFMTLSEKEAAEVEMQKKTDTDSDGLTDYDELYIYKTSPYLVDSDSDGIDDKTEIFSNSNPNCPEGKDCLNNQVAVVDSTSAATAQDQTGGLLSGILNLDTSQLGAGSIQTKEDLQAVFSQMGAKEVRSLLISQGVPQEQVDAMTDQEIMDFFQVALTEASNSGQFDEILNEIPTDTTSSDSTSSTDVPSGSTTP